MKKVDIDKNELYDLYVIKGMRTKDIAKIYNVSPKTIRLRLHEHGIEVRQSSIENRKYHFNEHYFDIVDTKEKAYLLGFICADGWVAQNRFANPNLLGITVHEQDAIILEFAKKELQALDTELVYRDGSVRVYFCSVRLTSTLSNYGVVPNKSLKLNIRDVIQKANISNELIPSFILGYYDGDGGIYSAFGRNRKTVQWSCGFTGTKETCLFLQEYFDSGHIIDERSKSGKVFCFRMSGRIQVVTGLNKLYSQHSSFCLKRKYQKFLIAKSPTR